MADFRPVRYAVFWNEADSGRPVVAGCWSLEADRSGNPFVIYTEHSVYLYGNGCQENSIGGTCSEFVTKFRFSPALFPVPR